MELIFGLIGFCLAGFLVWYSFQSLGYHSNNNKSSGELKMAETPEWQALAAFREEIEADPMMDEAAKKNQLENWRNMASDFKKSLEQHSLPSQDEFNNVTTVAGRGYPFWGVIVLLPLAIGLTYAIGGFHSGSMNFPSLASSGPTANQALSRQAGHPGDGGSLEDRVALLEQRLKSQPEDINGWVLLARTQAALSRYAGSAASLKQALTLLPNHPHLMADLADMLAMANDRKLEGEPSQYIDRVLTIDPFNEKGLALAATAAQQAGDEALASKYWNRLSEVQQQSLASSEAPGAPPVQQPPSNTLVRATVSFPSNWADPTGNSVLFLFLKESPGPGRPLAAVRSTSVGGGSTVLSLNRDNFIGTSPQQLPDELYVQARLAVTGAATPDDRDLVSDWVKVQRSTLPASLNLSLVNQ